ncbi:MAG: CIA30 family protein [Gemmatimonadales bacterium]
MSVGTTVRAIALIFVMATGAAAQSSTSLIKNARVFDGQRMLGNRDVLIVAGKIARVAGSIAAPVGATVVDGTGKTLMPGLIDSHTHAYGDALQQALVFGVTTELDMFTDVAEAARLRAEQKADNVASRADLYSAGTLATVPHGHGTEYGFAIPTISTPDSAQSWVDARIREGSDYIKIVLDDGHVYGMSLPTLDRPTLVALINAAHKRGKMAVIHIGSADDARIAIESGADGLAHLFADRAPASDFGQLVAKHHAFVVPTLTVLTSITGVSGTGDLATDSNLKTYLSQQSMSTVGGKFPFPKTAPPRSVAVADATIKLLLAAGVPILAGTDAPNPGTAHGISMHREMELLVHAGLTNTQALGAATGVPARVFKLSDRGRIATGMRADLLLVAGDPTVNIKATRAIEGVWKGGVRLDRAAYAKTLGPILAPGAVAKKAEAGLISNFENGGATGSFGSGWLISTDKFAGGTSSAEMKVVDGGANGTKKSLGVTGTIVGPLPYAWGGVMFMAGSQPMQPADLSGAKSVHFWAKGDGGTYKIMLFAQSKGMQPLMQDFVAGPEWKEYDFPFIGFDGLDGHDILGVAFTGGPNPGKFAMQIDEVSLR